LLRYLEDCDDATIEEAALAASCLIALRGVRYLETAQTLKTIAETGSSGRRTRGRPVESH
jgi:hypothetical protein